jgi:hypothetical protein
MEEEFGADGDGAGPSRAQAVGGGRVTGPGETIADSGKWMRCVLCGLWRSVRAELNRKGAAQGAWNVCAG